MEWIKDCNQEALKTIIKAAKNIDGNYERMSDSTILKKIINEFNIIGLPEALDINHLKFDHGCLPDSYWMSRAINMPHIKLDDFPDRIKTREFFMAIAKKISLSGVPAQYRDDELCVHYINQNISNLIHAPKRLLTYEMCKKYVAITYLANMGQVPEHLLDYNLCLIFIENDGDIAGVPAHLIDQKLCELYAEKRHSHNRWPNLAAIPPKFRNEKVCNYASIAHFQYMPEEFRTQDKSIEYIRETEFDLIDLNIIPEKSKNTEFWKVYVECHGLRRVPKDTLTQEICDKVPLENYPKYYTSIPNKFRTKEHLVRMAKTSGIKHIPPKLITQELCNLASENDKCCLVEIPEEHRTKESYLDALRKYDIVRVYGNKNEGVSLIPKEYLALPEFKKVIKEKMIWILLDREAMDFDEFTSLYCNILREKRIHIEFPDNFFRKNGLKALAFWLCFVLHEKFVQFQKEIPEFASLPNWANPIEEKE